jgi:heterotetrameric sarcosine oxidase gamma subunit
VPELIAKSPLSGTDPIMIGGLRLSERVLGPITSVAIYPGQDKVVTKALRSSGLAFPAPNTFATAGDATLVWIGRKQAFLIGIAAKADDLRGAAQTDQSDGWAGLRIEGPTAADALMRLYPLDLRLQSFPQGGCARAPLNHMHSVLLRTAPYAFDVLVFRSMALTAWHEVEAAMKTLSARAALG